MRHGVFMNLWKNAGIPKKGWVCKTVEDLGLGNYEPCEMCGNEIVRYIHVMQHVNYPEVVNAGCVCAGKMTDDYYGARLRDAAAKKKASRKSYWLKRKWKVRPNGTHALKFQGQSVGVCYYNSKWSYFIHRQFSDRSFDSLSEAKLALFDRLNSQ